MFCGLVKFDYVVFKNNFYGMVFGFNFFDIISYKNCCLGKWYYEGVGKENFFNILGYRVLESYYVSVYVEVNDLVKVV